MKLFKKPWKKYIPEPIDLEAYTEPGVERGAKMSDVTNPDVLMFHEIFKTMPLEDAFDELDLKQKNYGEGTYVIDTRSGDKVLKYAKVKPTLIFNRRALNEVRHLNTLLNCTNDALEKGGYFWCHSRTAILKRKEIFNKYGHILGWPLVCGHYFWHRMCPKLKLTRWYYMWKTDGRNRTYNRIEVLGRLCRAGFEIVDEEFLHGEFFVLARKVAKPIKDEDPRHGPIIKLKRHGKDGKIIGVYKFRTMYAYSEYLQQYVYEHGGLQKGGKFDKDPRINVWGRFMRKTWLDELPMFINLFKGQMKLVGVRPLSRHYYSLYTAEMQQLHDKVKPGLLPPFYCEKTTPESIEDVMASERRYIEAYLKHPLRTDFKYFWVGVFNILFRKKRSK